MALLRAQALLDTERPTESHSGNLSGFEYTNGLWCAKAYALGARGALWLARDAQRRSPSPAGSRELLELRISRHQSLAKTMQVCLATAFESPAMRPLALAMLARYWVEQVASDEGETARPGMSEAWLVSAEVWLMILECHAASDALAASGIRPCDRHHPEDDFDEEDEAMPEAVREQLTGWEPDVPGHHAQDKGELLFKTHLADYWWGQPGATAMSLMGVLYHRCSMHLQRFQKLMDATGALNRAEIDADARQRLWLRERAVESGISRRAAAMLCSLDLAAAEGDTTAATAVQSFRGIYTGSIFEPTEDFVRSLHLYPDNAWAISCMTGSSFGGRVTIMDITPRTTHSEKILGNSGFRDSPTGLRES